MPVPSPVTGPRHVVAWLIRAARAQRARRGRASADRCPLARFPAAPPPYVKWTYPHHPGASPSSSSLTVTAGSRTVHPARARATPPRARGASRRIGTADARDAMDEKVRACSEIPPSLIAICSSVNAYPDSECGFDGLGPVVVA